MKRFIVSITIFTALFIGLRQAMPEGVLLYQGVVLGLLVSMSQAVIQRRSETGKATAPKDALLTFLMIYAFVFTVPTTVDRSYSVRMLNRIAESPDGLSREEVARGYVRYFVAGGGVDKRIEEQVATGSIRERAERFEATALGRMLHWSFLVTGWLFACSDRR